jgi:diguanylate cyclase (GGDEF)-like protein
MKRVAVTAAVCAFLIAAAVAAGFMRFLEGRRVDNARRAATEIGTSQAFAIARQIDTAIGVAQRLAAIAEHAPLGGFNTAAKGILAENPVVFAGAFARDMRIAAVEPADAPDLVLTDLAADRSRAADIKALQETGKPIVTAPARGVLLVYAPVRTAGRVSGAVISYARVEDVLRLADVARMLRSGYEHRITTAGGGVLSASTKGALPQPVSVNIPILSTPWILEVAPARGWGDRGALARQAAAALIVSLMIALFVYELLRRPEMIEMEAEVRAHKIVESRAKADLLRGEASTARDATHDPVTDLPNRRFVLERLARAIDRARHVTYVFGVVIIDLGTPGATDGALVGITQRLQGCLRFGDVLARTGEAEFSVVAFEVGDVTDLIRIAQRCSAVLSPAAAIGIAMSSGSKSTPDGLLRDAQVAITHARAQKGPARYAFFDPDIHRNAVATLQLERDMMRAVPEGELRALFQTVVSLSSRTATGVEALIRWQHAGRMVLPAEFLPVAVSSGAIVSFDRWMLRAVAQQLRAAPVTTSVNVALKTLLDPSFLGDVDDVVRDLAGDGRSLQVEVSERALLERPDDVSNVLSALKDLGVTVVVDDFGSGPSSLPSLRSFPIDAVKTRTTADIEVLRALVCTAQTFGWRVTVKNIETEEQLEHAAALGCDHGQGHFFSKPAEAKAIESLLVTNAKH